MILLNTQLQNHVLENEECDSDKNEKKVKDLTQKNHGSNPTQPQPQPKEEEESASGMDVVLHNSSVGAENNKVACWKAFGFVGPISYTVLGYLISRITTTMIPGEYDKHEHKQRYHNQSIYDNNEYRKRSSMPGFFFENVFYSDVHNAWVLTAGVAIVAAIVIAIAIAKALHILYSFAWIPYSNYQEKVFYESKYKQCRKRIQIALGSIAAPSLLPQSIDVHVNAIGGNEKGSHSITKDRECEKRVAPTMLIIRFLQTISTFTEKHSNLLSSIDRSIQMIRVVTSIQLGLGPASLSVDRVENISIHKQQRQQQQQQQKDRRVTMSSAAPVAINLKIMRSVILKTLEKEASSIQQIRRQIFTMRFNKACNQDRIVDDELMLSSLNHLQSANLLTITLLKSMRIYVGDILSETLSLLFNSLPKFFCTDENTRKEIEIENLVLASTSMAEELEIYLHACLPGGERSINNCLYNKCSQGKQISQLQSYVDGVSATFWAFRQSIEHNEANSTCSGEWSVETELLWKRLNGEICTVADLSSSINYYRDQVNNHNKVKSNGDDDSVYDEKNSNCQKVNEKEEYHDKGKNIVSSSSSSNNNSQPQLKLTKNKTLVFSGNGAKSHQRHTKKIHEGNKTSSATSAATRRILPQSFIGQQSRGRTILLRELQSRLEMLETAEEWDAMTNQKVIVDDHDDTDTAAKTDSPITSNSKSSEVFLGVSGSLLSELKGALLTKSNTDGDFIDEYG